MATFTDVPEVIIEIMDGGLPRLSVGYHHLPNLTLSIMAPSLMASRSSTPNCLSISRAQFVVASTLDPSIEAYSDSPWLTASRSAPGIFASWAMPSAYVRVAFTTTLVYISRNIPNVVVKSNGPSISVNR